ASPSVACRRRFWREGSAVRHTPIRHPSNHSDISSDRDRTSLDSCPSTSKVPPNRPQIQWITSDSRESRSSRTDTKAERLGGLEVDHQFELARLLDRQIGWFLAFENAPGVDANLVVRIAEAAAIAYQAAGAGVLTVREDRGQRMAGRQRRELFHALAVEDTGADQDRTNALLRKSCEG